MSTPGPVNLRPRSKLKTIAFVAIGILGAATATILWLRSPDAERKAILNLPEPERRALYERTLRTLEANCRPEGRANGLANFCHRQANFIVSFPECDGVCRALAAPYQAVPTR